VIIPEILISGFVMTPQIWVLFTIDSVDKKHQSFKKV
jgi:hypothetical protein